MENELSNYQRLLAISKVVHRMNKETYYDVIPKYINERNYEIGIEIGVLYGGHILNILENTDIKKMIGIDPYKYYGVPQSGATNQDDFDTIYEIANKNISDSYRSQLIRDTSENAFHFCHNLVPVCDFVFIDGHHEYEFVKKDIELYSQIIVDGGMLCGHDYNNFEGVTKAVDEYAKRMGKKIIEEKGTVWIINF